MLDLSSLETLTSEHNKNVAENQLSAQIYALIEHYKQTDPLGIPGSPIPDPFPVPEVQKSLGFGTLTMRNALAYGFSKFRIKSIDLNVKSLTVSNSSRYVCVSSLVDSNSPAGDGNDRAGPNGCEG